MTRRDLVAALVGAAIVGGATYFGGPAAGKAAKATVVPVVVQAIREGVKEPAPDHDRTRRARDVAGAGVIVCKPPDRAYYRALLRAGVFPVTRHAAVVEAGR